MSSHDGKLHIGEMLGSDGKRNGTDVELPANDLVTHGVLVGMTGSGKTGLLMAMMEETLLQGIPVIMIDPKGDLGNLCLTFPNLAPTDFAPWVPSGTDPATVATTWKEGLAGWGLDGNSVGALRDAAPVTIYTPGSNAGIPLNVIGSMAPTPGGDEEARHDEIESFVSGLLRLVGIDADPLSSREHILLSNLIDTAWKAGATVDLPGLITQIQQPPMRKLGVIDLDTFFPSEDRAKFALKINGLLASPSFASWMTGTPLDVQQLLFGSDGAPQAAVISIAHCNDDERMFLVTLLLSKIVTWMRSQSGTTNLRALVAMDEVSGYVPPTAAPPSKKPILTLLKQARAFGVGFVVATQNPVDVDYKALSNAGTWLIGRLQTEQDKARLMDGLHAVSGEVDIAALSDTISHLDKRQFVWHQAGRHEPVVFTSRWAMSYLAGPLTKEQISTLMADRPRVAPSSPPAASTTPEVAAPASTSAAPSDAPTTAAPPAVAPGSASSAPSAESVATPSADELGADESPIAPPVADGVPVKYLDPAAPWASTIGAVPTGTRYEAAISVTVQLRYDEESSDLVADQTYEAIVCPLTGSIDTSTVHQVDFDERDFRAEQPAGIKFALPTAKINTAGFWKKVETDLRSFLVSSCTMEIFQNNELKLVSRAGETKEAFLERCTIASNTAQDTEAEKLRTTTQKKLDALESSLAKAEDRVEELKTDTNTRRGNELLQGATSVLGALLGGRKSASSIARTIGGAASRRSQSMRTAERLESAKHRAEEHQEKIDALEAEVAAAITALHAEWEAKAAAITPMTIRLERTDVATGQLQLFWYPTA